MPGIDAMGRRTTLPLSRSVSPIPLMKFPLLAALLCPPTSALLAQSVIINEAGPAPSERVLQFSTTGAPRLGSTVAWTEEGYDASWWASGAGPFGFGYTQTTDVAALMLDRTPALYLRKEFTLTAPQAASTDALQLVIDYDDGFIAFLNGVEVARRNLGAPQSFAYHDQTAWNVRKAAPTNPVETISLGSAASRLKAGANVLAIQVHNAAQADSSGRFFKDPTLRCDATLRVASTTPQNLVTSADTWKYLAGAFEPSGGLVDPVDFALPVPPLATGPTWTQPAFDDSASPWTAGTSGIGFDTATDYRAQLGQNATTMLSTVLSASMRRAFTLTQAEFDSITSLNFTVDYDDGYVFYVNGEEIERTGLPGAAGTVVPWNQAATSHGGVKDNGGNAPVLLRTVPLAKSRLRPGLNVIAGQVHNSTPGSSDLLLDIRLTAATAGTPLTLLTFGSTIRWRMNPHYQTGAEFAVGSVQPVAVVPPEPAFFDFVELKNPGTTPVSLAGWGLSDSAGLPLKWTFPPGTTLPAGGLLAVACSSRNVASPAPGGLFHTNFNLNSDGETVTLSNAAGALVSQLAVPKLDGFHTWGTDPASGLLRILDRATPGRANAGNAVTGQVDTPDFSADTGFYTKPFTLSLSCLTPGATIKYTVDGTEPTETNGYTYSGTFNPVIPVVNAGPGTGYLLREVWTGFNSGDLDAIPVGTTPNLANLLPQAAAPSDWADSYATRLRGFVQVTTPGTYTFYIATDDNGDLWLSPNDNPAARTRIAYVSGWTGSQEWTKFPATQVSVPVTLVAGQRYYIEARQQEGGGGDNIAIGWSGPGIPGPVVIAGRYLSPPDVLPPNLTPLSNTEEACVRARAFLPGLQPSPVRTRNYALNFDERLKSIPAIFLTGDPGGTFYAPNGVFTIAGGNWNTGGNWLPNDAAADYNFCLGHGAAFERPATAEFLAPGNVVQERTTLGLRFAGSPWSRPIYKNRDLDTKPWNRGWEDRPQMNLQFRADLGVSDLSVPGFIPGSSLKKWDSLRLRAGKNDAYNPFIIDELMRRLYAGMGQPSVLGDYANVFLNGRHKGFFNTAERPREPFFQEYWNSANTWDVVYISDLENGDWTSYNAMRAWFQANDLTSAVNYATATAWWDMTNVADYYLLNAWAGTADWPGNNFVLERERVPGGLWRWTIWDAEGAFGLFGQPNTKNTFTEDLLLPAAGVVDTGIGGDGLISRLVIRRAAQNAEFRLLFADRIQRHFFNDGVLSPAQRNALHDAQRARIEPVIAAHLGQSFNDSFWTGWVAGDTRTTTFLAQARTAGLWPATLAPVAGPSPGLIQSGQPLTLTNPNAAGIIYYTTNGTDPRAAGGAVQGKLWTSPLAISGPVTVKSRVFNGGEWSPLVDLALTPAPPHLVITEIYYNPPGQGDSTEFLELANLGTTTGQLAGMHFTSGITFAFTTGSLAPGQRLVLVKDQAAFTAAHPGVPVAGVYTGSLDNAGETLTLADYSGAVVCSVTYGTGQGWPAAADGGGYSLVLQRPQTSPPPDSPASWRAGGVLGGAPGLADSTTFPGTYTALPRTDTDGDGFTDLVEYALGTDPASAASLPALVAGNAGGVMTVSADYSLAADDLLIDGLESPTMIGWTFATVLSDTPLGNGFARRTWLCQSPPPGQSRNFFRLYIRTR